MLKASSRKRVQLTVVGAALVAVGVGVMAGVAYAHHADIVAQSDCSGVVSFTVTDWKTSGPGSINPDIRVSYKTSGGFVTVADGAFTTGHTTFSGTFVPTPDTPGTVVQLQAVAVASWGDGAKPGSTRSTSLTLPGPCTTTTAPTTTTIRTTTTVQTTTTVRPTTTTPTSLGTVLGTVVTTAPPALSATQRTLAFTGSNTTWGLFLGGLMILLGASLLAVAVRAR